MVVCENDWQLWVDAELGRILRDLIDGKFDWMIRVGEDLELEVLDFEL